MKNHSSTGMLSIGEVAHLAGVSPDTLRHYESRGLLAPVRAANGYRTYSEDAVARVRLVRAALAVGFGLNDLARLLKVRDAGGAPCRQVRDLAATRLEEVETLIDELCTMREELVALLEDWDQRLRSEPTRPVRLLESLPMSSFGMGERNVLRAVRKLQPKSRKKVSKQ